MQHEARHCRRADLEEAAIFAIAGNRPSDGRAMGAELMHAAGFRLKPEQRGGWTLVSLAKLNAWFLLMILSYTMVACVNGVVPAYASNSPSSRVKAATTSMPA